MKTLKLILRNLKTFKFTTSVLFLLFVFSTSNGQQLPQEKTYGLRIGIDVSRLPLYFADPKIKGLEWSVDIEALPKFYPTLELGYGAFNIKKDNYQYKSNNQYLRVGFDYNILKTDAEDLYSIGYIGFRYGYSSLSYYAKNVIISDEYWGDRLIDEIDKPNMNIHWIELVAGLKAEIFPNFFMGWSFRGRFMLSKTKDEIMDPYKIPGYGKGSSKSAIGFNYSLYYKFPLYKKSE